MNEHNEYYKEFEQIPDKILKIVSFLLNIKM